MKIPVKIDGRTAYIRKPLMRDLAIDADLFNGAVHGWSIVGAMLLVNPRLTKKQVLTALDLFRWEVEHDPSLKAE